MKGPKKPVIKTKTGESWDKAAVHQQTGTAEDDDLAPLLIADAPLKQRLQIKEIVDERLDIAPGVIRNGHLFVKDELSPEDVIDVFAHEKYLVVLKDISDIYSPPAMKGLNETVLKEGIENGAISIDLFEVDARGERDIILNATEFFTCMKLRKWVLLSGPLDTNTRFSISFEALVKDAAALHDFQRLKAIYDWQEPKSWKQIHTSVHCQYGILHCAAWLGKTGVIREMVSGMVRDGTNGADPMVRSPTKEYPVLHMALGSIVAPGVTSEVRRRVVFELLKSPLLTEENLNLKTDGRRGTTALHRAVYQGTLVKPGAADFFDYQDIAQMLVERGARSDVVCYENPQKKTWESAQLLADRAGMTLQAPGEPAQFHMVTRALQRGVGKLNRGKVSLFGDGGVGKTALARSLKGENFKDTSSTVGIVLDVLSAPVVDVLAPMGAAAPWSKPPSDAGPQFEAALAREAHANQRQQPFPTTVAPPAPPSYPPPTPAPAPTSSASVPSSVPAPAPAPAPALNDHLLGEKKVEAPTAGALVDGHVSMTCLVQPNNDYVLRYLGEMALAPASSIIIHLMDFGGQPEFSTTHNMFISSHSVNTVVFNMKDAVEDCEVCMSQVKSWVNAIVLHTLEGGALKVTMSPIIFVGTHVDHVDDYATHLEAVSMALYDALGSLVDWEFVIKNEEPQRILNFFPVDNTARTAPPQLIRNPTVDKLAAALERGVKELPCMKEDVALTWLKCFDEMVATKRPFLALKEVEDLAEQNFVPEDQVHAMLRFFHQMNMVLWIENDERGEVADSLLHVLLGEHEARKETIVQWMVRLGLLVPMPVRRRTANAMTNSTPLYVLTDVPCYIAPALLPNKDPKTHVHPHAHSCWIWFTTSMSDEMHKRPSLGHDEMAKRGFLPPGFFERLMARAYRDEASQPPKLCKDWMLLNSEGQRVTIEADSKLNCLRVGVMDGSPMAVLLRLIQLVRCVIADVMPSLSFSVWLRVPSSEGMTGPGPIPTRDSAGLGMGEEVDERKGTWLNWQAMRQCVDSSTNLVQCDNTTIHPCAHLKRIIGGFWANTSYLNAYDLFLSYRWKDADKLLTAEIFEYMERHNVGSPPRAIDVFRDNNRMDSGDNFLEGFANALCRSAVLLPVISSYALERMRVKEEPQCDETTSTYANNVELVKIRKENAQSLNTMEKQVDYTLLEWVMGLVCYDADPRNRRIVPFLLGECKDADIKGRRCKLDGNFEAPIYPVIVPVATLIKAEELLTKFAPNLAIPHDFHTWTVRGILVKLKMHLTHFFEDDATLGDIIKKGCAVVISAISKTLPGGGRGGEDLAPGTVVDRSESSTGIVSLENDLSRLAVATPLQYYAKAFALLQDERKYRTVDGQSKFQEGKQLLEMLGVCEAADLKYLKSNSVHCLKPLLKEAPMNKLLRILELTPLIRDTTKYKTSSQFREGMQLLDELGVDEADDLQDLGGDSMRRLSLLLKEAPSNKLLSVLGLEPTTP